MIILLIVIFVLFVILSEFFEKREDFTNINNMNQDTNKLVKFCRRLKQFDRPSEHTLMLKNFRKRKVESNNKIINDLLAEIDTLQKDAHLSSIDMVNAYKCQVQKNVEQKMEAINKAKSNIMNRNTVNLNVTAV